MRVQTIMIVGLVPVIIVTRFCVLVMIVTVLIRMLFMRVMIMAFFCMLVVVMLIMVVLVMLGVIIMFIMMVIVIGMVAMIGMIFVIVMLTVTMVIVIIVTKHRGLAEAHLDQPLGIHQLLGTRLRRDGFNRIFQLRSQLVTNPEHNIRVLKAARLARTHRITMRRDLRLDQKRWLADTLHHLRHQRMHRRNVRHNFWGLCQGHLPEAKRQDAPDYTLFHLLHSWKVVISQDAGIS